ncbi:carbonic anhydrase [Streptomyces sp. NPDC090108]|uniref:carbonic anhydrase n=1 Tax=Streptomyces sp. NPDC090108 TaxID=3365947 RepID=UPI0037F95762
MDTPGNRRGDAPDGTPAGAGGRTDRRGLLAGALAGAAVALTGCSATGATTSAAPAASTGAARPAGTAGTTTGATDSASPQARPGTPAEAFKRLMDGNRRWVSGNLQHPDRDPDRRQFVAEKQEPFGSVLSCIDSRVPPELLFDTGLGDLYVMRTGGEAVEPVVTGSVEYGPLTSNTPLVVVLGHQRCGAVQASYQSLRDGKPLPGGLQAIAEALRPAYEKAVKEGGDDPVETMARAQVTLTAAALRSNDGLGPLVDKGALAVVGAYYSLDTGKVEILSGAPS